MDQTTMRVYVSLVDDESNHLKSTVFTSCARFGFDPYIFDWDLAKSIAPESFVEKRMEECQLFVGIYDDSYGQRVAISRESHERVSAVDFELQTAFKLLGSENVRLFARKVDERDAELNRMLNPLRGQVKAFENDLALLIDEAIKDWYASVQLKRQTLTPRTVSVQLECPDRTGILAALYRALFAQGGNVVRSHQTTHLGSARVAIIAQWHESSHIPEEAAVKEAILREVQALLGDSAGTLEVVRVVAREGEVRARGSFEVLFYDGPGIAERIFAVFSRAATSVVESHLIHVSATPPLAKFSILVNATNITYERVNHLADELRGQGGVVAVESYLELGHWWY